MGRRIASGPRFLAGRLRSTVGLIVLLTPLTGFVDAARAATCNPADAGEVKAAIAEIERSLDPCGESAEVRDVLHQFSQCAARGFRICTDRRSERNFIERADGVADGVHATITWNPALRTELEWGCNGDPTRAVRRDPAASLLHELVHAVQDCSGLDPAEHEFEAVRIENIYRRARQLCQRTRYGEQPLPAAMLIPCDPGHCVCQPVQRSVASAPPPADAATASRKRRAGDTRQ
jgi:hypothetical protein